MSSLGQLVAGVAHEINNPVNFIFGNLSYANDYTQDLLRLIQFYQQQHPDLSAEMESEVSQIDLEFLMEDLPRLLASMRIGAERIQKIVASLRTFSRMDEAEMKDVNLHECLDSTLMILQSRLKASPVRPEIKVIREYGTLPLIECYAGQLNQAFMNILSNAIDALEDAFTNQVQYAPCITICTRLVDQNQVSIEITDNGSGMSLATQQRLFDPFFTTKAIGKGTGLGLSISYQIVTERHQGSLRCTSEPGRGSSFMIKIPMAQTCPTVRV
ncbi:sensor histidine kinase [Oculatella sp. LEGE 06141]|nr:ATP-binding protein [Oculatella sp. LEGE 06141]